MLRALNSYIVWFSRAAALSLLLAGCQATDPTFDVTSVGSFTKTLFSVKAKVPSEDRGRLENALFAIALQDLIAPKGSAPSVLDSYEKEYHSGDLDQFIRKGFHGIAGATGAAAIALGGSLAKARTTQSPRAIDDQIAEVRERIENELDTARKSVETEQTKVDAQWAKIALILYPKIEPDGLVSFEITNKSSRAISSVQLHLIARNTSMGTSCTFNYDFKNDEKNPGGLPPNATRQPRFTLISPDLSCSLSGVKLVRLELLKVFGSPPDPDRQALESLEKQLDDKSAEGSEATGLMKLLKCIIVFAISCPSISPA
jgi:hypothetical protein